MSKKTVLEIARKKEAVEKDLEKFTELKEDAFRVFGYGICSTLDFIQKSYDSGAWYELRCWHDYYQRHSGYFHFQDAGVISEAFQQVSTATINRKEFFDMLSESRDDIEKYIRDLTAEVQNLEQQLDKAYDDFVKREAGEYKWIFEQSFVKELVLKFQLSEIETE